MNPRVTLLSLWRGPIAVRYPPQRTLAEIVADVAARHDLHPELLIGPSRLRHLVIARQEAMAEAHATGRYSLPRIGRYLGGRDHTTVLHGVRAHRERSELEIGKCRSALPMVREVGS